ncbi:uroporphyrinogen decarboxylase/cobalamine-independent methonine synthase family protein [Streptoalloteichus hindustanus]|uniref:Cobalamin-independent synthase, Catalytic domain n=1 Tax=Streptoalloteichus hindustanus TaxID=2017 RepID=A0A1M5GNH4_STRHI|nr:methionine synthase [Streptoalloteichus hindustanus]SHG05227.1 Cobalamin-independent synthase, Catalytic domain [Streptoalloteichus hindustanus]
MSNTPWPAGTATGIGSLPGTDPLEAARVVVGELPALPHLPELPARGVGADMIGRTAGLLVDLAVEVIPTGYRVTARPGADHRRAVDLLRRDLDAFDEATQAAGARPAVVKTQLAGPWTLTAGIELVRGHRVLTDHGALREFAESLAEGLTAHVRELAARTGAQVVVQLDEPTLPAALAGALSTPSGYGTVRAVEESTAVTVLGQVVAAARAATGQPVVVHCCAPRPPLRLLRRAGADALALDVSLLRGAPPAVWDELGEVWDGGATLFLGLLPGLAPERAPGLREVAPPALELVDRLGFARSWLADRAVVTPSCGMAGATADWTRRAMTLARDLGRAFVEPPESW